MNKTLNQVLADMRIDLKDSVTGVLWQDTELARCVEKAVADFSRFIPRELIYEERLSFAVTGEAITTPATTNLTAIVSAQALNVSNGSLLTIAGQPDVPRKIRLTITDSNNSTKFATFIIRGTDKDNRAQEEIFYYVLGGSKTLNSTKEFKVVFEVELNQNEESASTDTLSVGYGLFTDPYVYLAHKPIKFATESLTNVAGTTKYARNTDYTIDYANGKIKAIAGGSLAAATAYTIAYTKDQLGVDISSLEELIRVSRVEYPVGTTPQSFVPNATFGNMLTITGQGENESQEDLMENKHVRVYYDAKHIAPTTFSPGTYPGFLEDTVIQAADAYALLVYSLKCEHQSLTDLDSARTAMTAATTAQTALGTALTNIAKYLSNNSNKDAAAILDTASISLTTTALASAAATFAGVAGTEADAVLALANAYFAAVAAASTGDLTLAAAVWTDYGATYITGGTGNSIVKYLTDGVALLNTVTVGGEGVDVPIAYAQYAQALLALIHSFEQKRTDYIQSATARTNAGLGYVQSAAQTVAEMRVVIDKGLGYVQEASQQVAAAQTIISKSAVYVNIANGFWQEAQGRLETVRSYLQQAAQYVETAGGDLVMADRFKAEGNEKRNQVWSIWQDRKQYIGDFAGSSVRQIATG